MIIPSDKKTLVEEIHSMTNYSYKVINDIYLLPQKIEPKRSKYYARRAGIKRLQGFYSTLKSS